MADCPVCDIALVLMLVMSVALVQAIAAYPVKSCWNGEANNHLCEKTWHMGSSLWLHLLKTFSSVLFVL